MMSQRNSLLASLGAALLILFTVVGFAASLSQSNTPTVDVVQVDFNRLISAAVKDRNRFAVDIPRIVDASQAGIGSWSVVRDGHLALFGACTHGRVAFVSCGEHLSAAQRATQNDALTAQATINVTAAAAPPAGGSSSGGSGGGGGGGAFDALVLGILALAKVLGGYRRRRWITQ